MNNSILTSTKKILGIDESYTAFDPDVIIHINTALSTLNQLGIGPDVGMAIEDATVTWDAFFDDDRMNAIKSYVYLRVRILFDPPGTSFHLTSMENQIKEMEWRLNAVREHDDWLESDTNVDGGDATGTVV